MADPSQVTQVIDALPESPKEGSGYRVRITAWFAGLVKLAQQLEIFRGQINTVATEVNAAATTASEGIATVTDAATTATGAADTATAAAATATAKADEAAASAVAAGTAQTGSEAARDVASAAAERAQAAISGSVWMQPLVSDGSVAAVAYMSPETLSVAGDESQLGNFPARRAIKLTQTSSGPGYVAGAVYDADAGHVVVTVTGVAVDEGLSEVWLGQAPDNAPQQTVSSPLMAQIFG